MALSIRAAQPLAIDAERRQSLCTAVGSYAALRMWPPLYGDTDVAYPLRVLAHCCGGEQKSFGPRAADTIEILHPSGVQNDKVIIGGGYVLTYKLPSTTLSF